MKALIGGGSGFIGSHLVRLLAAKGYNVTVISRRPNRNTITWNDIENNGLPENTDAVVNLAGNRLMDFTSRFDETFQRRLYASRVHTNQQLVAAIAAANTPPRVFIASSGVGYYKSSLTAEYNEDSIGGSNSHFLSKLSRQVEESAMLPKDSPTRSVITRIGLALGREGGAIFQMFIPFYLGLGGAIGSGEQWFPWVHVADVAGFMSYALANDNVKGIYNLTAPDYVTNAEFTKAFAKQLNRPALIPVPELAIKMIYGPERATTVTQGMKVIPKRTLQSGYKFLFPDIKSACKEFAHFAIYPYKYDS